MTSSTRHRLAQLDSGKRFGRSKKQLAAAPHELYLLKSGEFVKFGITTSWGARRGTIQTGAPHKVVKLAEAQFPNKREAERVEDELLAATRADRTDGGTEWRTTGPDTALKLFDTAVKAKGADSLSPAWFDWEWERHRVRAVGGLVGEWRWWFEALPVRALLVMVVGLLVGQFGGFEWTAVRVVQAQAVVLSVAVFVLVSRVLVRRLL